MRHASCPLPASRSCNTYSIGSRPPAGSPQLLIREVQPLHELFISLKATKRRLYHKEELMFEQTFMAHPVRLLYVKKLKYEEEALSSTRGKIILQSLFRFPFVTLSRTEH